MAGFICKTIARRYELQTVSDVVGYKANGAEQRANDAVCTSDDVDYRKIQVWYTALFIQSHSAEGSTDKTSTAVVASVTR